MTDDLSRRLTAVLRQHLRFLRAQDQLSMTDELQKLGLDSMAAIDLVLAVEEAFGVQFPDELLVPATFATPASLLAAVSELTKRAS